MRNSALINIHMIHSSATAGVKRYFFSSSACVYRDMEADEPELAEDGGLPGPARQRVRLGEALRRAHGHGLRPAIRDDRPARPVPELLRPGGHVARRPGKGPGGALPQDRRGRRTAGRSRSGATARPCGPTPTSTTWSTASSGSCIRTSRTASTSAARNTSRVDELARTIAAVAGKDDPSQAHRRAGRRQGPQLPERPDLVHRLEVAVLLRTGSPGPTSDQGPGRGPAPK